MVDAGCRKIPYVASALPAYKRWNHAHGGGYIVDNPQEWESCLSRLVSSVGERETLGQEGWIAAQTREQNKLVDIWEETLDQLYEAKNAQSRSQNNTSGSI